jgi:hypothetical protein
LWPTREDSYPEVCGSAVSRTPAVVETIGDVIDASARDPAKRRTHLRPIKVAVVGDPAANGRIIHRSQLFQGFVAAVMQRPAADFPPDAHKCFRTGRRQEAMREDALSLQHPHRLASPELEHQEVEADVGEVAPPIGILAVDCFRLLRMQHQLAIRHPGLQRLPQGARLGLGTAVTDRIVGITLERNVRELPHHPHVEGVVQEQVCQQRGDHPALRRARRARDEAILHLHGRPQPALDVGS